MEKVTGIGGVFFKAGNPRQLSEWYEQHLGITMPPGTYEDDVWKQQAGPTKISSNFGCEPAF